jgi:hypothetical protein
MAQGVPWMPTAAHVEKYVLDLPNTPLAQAGPIGRQILRTIAEMAAVGSMPSDQAQRLDQLTRQRLVEVEQWQSRKQEKLEQLTLSMPPVLPTGNATTTPTSSTE